MLLCSNGCVRACVRASLQANYYVQPICTPTRAGLMTGRYSIHTGSEHILFGAFEDSCLPLELPLMPVAFKKIGYQTHAIGKWHLGYTNDTCAPWGREFDSYLGYLNGNAGYYCNHHDFHECNAPAQIAAAGAARTYFNATGKIDAGLVTHCFSTRVHLPEYILKRT